MSPPVAARGGLAADREPVPPVAARRGLRRIRANSRLLAALGLAALLAVLAAALISRDGPRAASLEVVRVTSGDGIATGFAVGGDSVVTVAHVIDRQVRVGGVRARVLRVDRRTDLALLSVPGVRSARLESASAAAGDELRLWRLREGRTSELSVRVRRAIMAHVRAPGARRAQRRPALELDARATPGDSGAPLLTDAGALAGVLFAASRGRAGTAYAVDAAAVRRLLGRRSTPAGA